MTIVWYDRIVREPRITRVSLALLCIALLLCTVSAPAAHLDLALPPLVFCFLVVVTLSLLRVSDGECRRSADFLPRTAHLSRPSPGVVEPIPFAMLPAAAANAAALSMSHLVLLMEVCVMNRFPVPGFLNSLFDRDRSTVERIHALRAEFGRLSDIELRATASKTEDLPGWIALAATAALRVLGQEMYDVQLRGALALARGSIAEMQTGEGKTLAAVPAICWFAREHRGVHVMTVNDYLARRDAAWMGGIYRLLGLSIAHVQQGMTPAERRAAYAADITYATQNEIGFDFLRDRIALRPEEQVHREFHAVVIDEADSILIDEARVPLVIAAGETGDRGLAYVADQMVRGLRAGEHFTTDPGGHNVALTDAGIHAVEIALGCANLFDSRQPAGSRRHRGSAARSRTAAPRCRLPRQERGHRDGGRVQGPGGARSPLACRTAHGYRSQGRCGGEVARNDSRPDHAAAPGGVVPDGMRHDGHGRHAIAGVPPRLRPAGRDDPDQPPEDPRRSSGRHLPDEG